MRSTMSSSFRYMLEASKEERVITALSMLVITLPAASNTALNSVGMSGWLKKEAVMGSCALDLKESLMRMG